MNFAEAVGKTSDGFLKGIGPKKKMPSNSIINFPSVRQATTYSCGAAALQSVFQFYGVDLSEEAIAELVCTTKRDGTHYQNIVMVAKSKGFKVDAKQNMDVSDLENNISDGIPTIVQLQAWPDHRQAGDGWQDENKSGHFVVVIGFDESNLYFEDPMSVQRTYLPKGEFERRWHDVADGSKLNRIGITIIGKSKSYNDYVDPMG